MKTIVIVGVGALGSQAVLLMRNLDATIRVIDFDRVEAKNVQSQFHGKSAIGQPKVLALRGAMHLLFGVTLVTNSNKLVANNVKEMLGGTDLVIDCVDNGATRRLMQEFVRKNDIPCLHGAVDANGTFGRIIWDENFVIDDEDAVAAPTCENGEHLPFLCIVSAHIAHAAKEFLTKGSRLAYQVSPGGTTRFRI